MAKAQALALDGHGVVYYRPREVVDALVDHLELEWNLSLDPEEVKRVYLALQERAFAEEISYLDMIRAFCQHLGATSLTAQRYVHELIQRYSAAIEIDADLRNVLEELRRRGVIIGMVTNSIHPAEVKRRWLERTGIAHLFDLIVSSVDERCRKPYPEIFQRFAVKVSVPPEQIVFVGHDEQEITGAKAAGLIAVCLRGTCKQADYAISRFGELLQLSLWGLE